MLLFSALLYWRGEQVAQGIRHFATRLAGVRGDAAVLLAAQAIRAVALGVVVTALVQAVLGGIGLAVSGVPYATLLTVLMILSCLVQLGPLPVLIPAIIWLYWTGDTTWGTVLLVWSGVVGTLDNVIRPMLIRMGADLPLILILSGVIGGLIAFRDDRSVYWSGSVSRFLASVCRVGGRSPAADGPTGRNSRRTWRNRETE